MNVKHRGGGVEDSIIVQVGLCTLIEIYSMVFQIFVVFLTFDQPLIWKIYDCTMQFNEALTILTCAITIC